MILHRILKRLSPEVILYVAEIERRTHMVVRNRGTRAWVANLWGLVWCVWLWSWPGLFVAISDVLVAVSGASCVILSSFCYLKLVLSCQDSFVTSKCCKVLQCAVVCCSVL